MPANEPTSSDSWYESSSWPNAEPREFLVSVELWCPSKTTGTVRKPQLPRRTSEKRESVGGSIVSNDEKKIREKPGWFRTHVNSSTASGSWRPARCKLYEDLDRSILNIYLDETILQYSIYVHLLRCTDVRPADRSLFFRSNCLGIHVKAGQRWLDSNTEEIIYLKFSSSEAINTWIALLRSYAIAEIYGRNFAPSDGGLYRMWRQVCLEIIQARNLGSAKAFNEATGSPDGGDMASDAVDMEVSCEIIVNDALCGRTTVRKGLGSPEWHEQFALSDLPPFGELEIRVYREKKVFKPQLLGMIQVVLSNFRRGEAIEGWYPVISVGQSVNGTQVGEIKLRMKVDEEIVMPISAYAPVLHCMATGNLLDLLYDLEQELKLEHVAEHVMAIAVDRGSLMRDLFELAEREVDGTSSSQNTLFRGNSILTKTMELAMNWFGKPFLEASVGPVVRKLIAEKVTIEVDVVRSGRGLKDQEKNVDSLVIWCKEIWNNIYSVRGECPQELRQLFQHIRLLVERRFDSSNRDMRWQSVSAFCFLRFIVPAILHPHLFGLCHGMPSIGIQRSLTLIAKVLQRLANLNPSVQKEEFMKGVKLFVKDSLPAMIDYIKEVSTPAPDYYGSSLASADKHDSILVMNALRERKSTMPTLHREALLFLPHLLDVPKHLAILSSAVVRSARQQRPRSPHGRSEILDAFTESCVEVEGKALKCVTQLGRPRSQTIRPRWHTETNSSQTQTFPPVGPPPIMSTVLRDDRPKRSSRKRLSLRTVRPATAPSTPESDRQGSRKASWDIADEPPIPLSPTSGRVTKASDTPDRAVVVRGPSNPEGKITDRGRRSFEEIERTAPTSERVTAALDESHVSEMDKSQGAFFEDTGDFNTYEDPKKRKRFLGGFLTKR